MPEQEMPDQEVGQIPAQVAGAVNPNWINAAPDERHPEQTRRVIVQLMISGIDPEPIYQTIQSETRTRHLGGYEIFEVTIPYQRFAVSSNEPRNQFRDDTVRNTVREPVPEPMPWEQTQPPVILPTPIHGNGWARESVPTQPPQPKAEPYVCHLSQMPF